MTSPGTDPRPGGVDRSPGLDLTVRPAGVARVCAIVTAVVVALGLVANRLAFGVAPHLEHPIARAAARFDLGLEPSVPALWSTFLLAACAVMLAVNGRAAAPDDPDRRTWYGLALVFLALAVDETVMVHEMANDTLRETLGTSGYLYFAWVIPGALFALAVAAASARFLFRLDPRTRALFLLAGTIFVGGAIGMELIAARIAETRGVESVAHMIEQAFEESMEMGGTILFLYALLDHLAWRTGSIRIAIGAGPDRETA